MNINAAIREGEAFADPAQRARQLRPLIESTAQSIEQGRALPSKLLEALHDAGLFRLLLPHSCGGEEVAPALFVAAVEELAKADASTAWCMAQGSGCSMAAAYLEPAVAREIFDGKQAVVAWGPAGPNAKAVAVEDGYRVSGTWPYASGIGHADWLGGHCQLLDALERPCLGPEGKPTERTMLFPKAKAEIHDVWHVMGLKGTGSQTYTVADLFVPARYSFTRESAADRHEAGPLYRFTTFQLFGAGFAGVALGIARATLDAFIAVAAGKVPMLAAKPLRDNAVVQSKVAIAEAQWQASRAYLMQTLAEMWHIASAGETFTLEQRAGLRLAGVHAVHECKKVIETVFHLAGGSAVFENQPFERRLRDINAVAQQVQGQSVNFEIAGQVLLGLPSTSKLI
jgi:alkylation response protein AidB-like acyl-CoA dehydrogenase